MGAKNSLDKDNINERIYLDLEEVYIESLDEIFADSIKWMRKIEELRRIFSIRWNSLCYYSGAISIKKPNFKTIIDGIFWKITVDIQVALDGIFQIELTKPFLEIKNKTLITDDLKEIIDAYAYFMEYFWEKFDVIDDYYKEIVKHHTRALEASKENKTYLNKIKNQKTR